VVRLNENFPAPGVPGSIPSALQGTRPVYWGGAGAGNPHMIPIGDTVICDFCSADFTRRPDLGAFIHHGYAVCPKCAERVKPGKRDVLPKPGESFADFILRVRGPFAGIEVIPIPRRAPPSS